MSSSENGAGCRGRPYFPELFLRGPFEEAKKGIVAEFERIHLNEVLWAMVYRRELGDDPAWDAAEAAALYDLLEHGVIPEF